MTIPTAALDGALHGLHEAATRAAVRARWFERPVLATASVYTGAPEDLSPLPVRWRPGDTTFFWEQPAEGRAVVGLGAAATIRAAGAGRCARLRTAIRRLVDTAVTGGVGSPDTPLLVGGLGFDAAPFSTSEWSAFPSALLMVPRMLVARSAGQCLVRLALMVDTESNLDREIAALQHDIEQLAAGNTSREGAEPVNPCTMTPWPPDDEWVRRATAVVDDIRRGSFEKLVLARTCAVDADHAFDPTRVAQRLRRSYPTCTTFWLSHLGHHFIGATPEILVTLRDGQVTSGAVAGSAPRGQSPDTDRRSLQTLRSSRKDRWEHALVVDAIATALRPLCASVTVAPEPQVLSLQNVHHLRTPVTARARDGLQLLDLVEALHPTPAVAGHPRSVALEALQRHEPFERGWYGGPVGWIDAGGGGEMAVAIRCALLHGTHACLYAGAGLVLGSEPEAELTETQMKLEPLLNALTEGLEGLRA